MSPVADKDESQYVRALDILDGRAYGFAIPILEALALRRYPPALSVLGDFVTPRRALELLRTGVRLRDPGCTYNLAIEYRNRGDLGRYRYWLARAARTYPDAREELSWFRTRFPHKIMRKFGRLCPWASWDR